MCLARATGVVGSRIGLHLPAAVGLLVPSGLPVATKRKMDCWAWASKGTPLAVARMAGGCVHPRAMPPPGV